MSKLKDTNPELYTRRRDELLTALYLFELEHGRVSPSRLDVIRRFLKRKNVTVDDV